MRVFRDLLVDSNVIPNKDELMNAINHKDNLFTDYIKNIRDVKRVVNQIIFEYPFIKDEIDLKDFINFIYFKLTFPKIIYILNENRNKFLEVISDNIYSLKEVKNNQVGNEINLFRPELLEVLKKYEVFKIYDKNTFDYLNIEDNKKLLFIKSLAYLFGSQNQTETYKSIRFENNFRKLMQQRLLESDIKESEFKELLKETNDNLNKKIKDFNNKIPQLFNRFNYFNTKNESEIKKVIEIICIIYNEYEEEYEIDCLKLLDVFTHRIFNNKKDNDFTEWSKDNIFNNSTLSPKTRLLLFGYLSDNSINTRLWDLEVNYIEVKISELFKEYLYKFDDNLWEINDFSFYRVYHSIKKVRNIQTRINLIILEFWSKNNIECLCAQSTDIDFDIIGQYKISDTIEEVFGSKSDYYNFICLSVYFPKIIPFI